MNEGISTPEQIFGEEIARIKISLDRLGIGFSISFGHWKQTSTELSKPPYLSCRYNAADMRNINIVAYYYPLQRTIFNVDETGLKLARIFREKARAFRAQPHLVFGS